MKFCVVRAAALAFGLVTSYASGQNDLTDRMIDEDVVISHSPDWSEPTVSKSSANSPVVTTGIGPIAAAARQPVGALSGRVVFMNSGHGWTWYTGGWSLQRPTALNAMNEDYGNLDQLNFFAAYCFNAGAIVASMRPLGQQTNEVVLDNISPAVAYSGAWSDSTSTIYFGKPGDVPYRFASIDNAETATATYTPNIPVAGYYPVYTWVRWGSDRGDQLYRIRHTGGETQYRVPHYLVGNGWVYLGEYFFNSGSNSANGAVIISNLRGSTNGTVVIADAIRFGNGMGSIDRGTGVSGYPREEESCRYWIQSNLGQGQSTNLYETSGNDEQDSWSAPPRMSVEMTRTAGTSFFKRIHLSFHSNASSDGSSRGVEGLITSVPTPNQPALAQICGSTVNNELVGLGSPPLEFPWFDRGTNITFSGAYGELSNNSFVNVMDATIIEVAYHDNATDAKLLRDSKARAAVGRAAMHAVVKYFNQFDTNDPAPLIFPPEPPANLRTFGTADGAIRIAWEPPVSVANSGVPTNYVIYQSTNGYGFGNPISVGASTNYTVTSLPAGADYYFRVSAANVGGESMPSTVVGCRTPAFAGSTKVLYVNAFDRFDRTTNLKQDLVAQHYVPPSGSGANERVLPRRVNSFDYVVPHGQAMSAFGAAFDTCQSEAVTNNLVALTNYPIVIWACGNESTADETFSSAEQSKVTAFLAGGGNLFASGAEIAWDLDRPSGPTTADRNFIHNQLHATFAADSSGVWNFNASASSIFSNNPSGTFDDGSKGIYLVGFPDVITPTGSGAVAAASYPGVSSGAAGIAYDGSAGGGKVVYLGFPFETITSASVRNEYLADVLNFFGANAKPTILAQPADQTVPGGGTANFSITAGSSTPMGYQWRFNGTNFVGGNSNTLQLVNAQPGMAGNYDVVVTNFSGAVTSSVAKLTVKIFFTVEAWGDNSFGQSAAMPSLTNIIAIAAGGYHDLALSNNGTVFAWGNDANGQCDLPPSLSNVTAIGAGGYHSLAARADGTVIAWGANDSGQISIPASATNVVAVAGGGLHSLALRADGLVIAWGDNSSGQTTVPVGATNIIAIAAGGQHSLALKSDGTVIAWGNNLGPYGTYSGQSTVPANLNQVVAIAAGGFHSLALKADGTIVGWGDNSLGQISIPPGVTNAMAIAAGSAHSVALRSNGTVAAWGDDLFGQLNVDPNLSGVSAVAAGNYHNLALRGPMPASPRLTSLSKNVGGFTVSVPTVRGHAYFLEGKTELTATQWTLLSAVLGDGGQKFLTDANVGAAQRFYRVRQQ